MLLIEIGKAKKQVYRPKKSYSTLGAAGAIFAVFQVKIAIISCFYASS